jgi:hypothetical protein
MKRVATDGFLSHRGLHLNAREFRERKGGRVVECAGLEIRCTVIPYRGFESHPFRQNINEYGPLGPFFVSTHQRTPHCSKCCRPEGSDGSVPSRSCLHRSFDSPRRRSHGSTPASAAAAALAAVCFGQSFLPRRSVVTAGAPLTRTDLIGRILAGAALTILVTTLSARVGAAWSGLLAVFPLLATVLSVSSHRTHGPDFVISLLRGMALGGFRLPHTVCFFRLHCLTSLHSPPLPRGEP